MGWLDKITEVATGGLAKQVTDLVKTYFPPDMPPEKLREFELQAQQIESDRQHQAELAAIEQDRIFSDRIRDMEGTASDLKAVPIFGPLVLFLRGLQRPVWGFATLWMDWYVFCGDWTLSASNEKALQIINLLVLGFLFGERAIMNLMPLINQFMAIRQQQLPSGGKP